MLEDPYILIPRRSRQHEICPCRTVVRAATALVSRRKWKAKPGDMVVSKLR
jgi:hypothetical protein